MTGFLAILLAFRLLGIPATVQTFSVSGYSDVNGVYPFLGQTASGVKTSSQTVACGPSFEYGTHFYIDGVGWRICQDRGPAITDSRLDRWFGDEESAIQWGRQELQVVVVRGTR